MNYEHFELFLRIEMNLSPITWVFEVKWIFSKIVLVNMLFKIIFFSIKRKNEYSCWFYPTKKNFFLLIIVIIIIIIYFKYQGSESSRKWLDIFTNESYFLRWIIFPVKGFNFQIEPFHTTSNDLTLFGMWIFNSVV